MIITPAAITAATELNRMQYIVDDPQVPAADKARIFTQFQDYTYNLHENNGWRYGHNYQRDIQTGFWWVAEGVSCEN
jgi:hypothetical protein